jgi:hypothetical protein
MSTCSQCGKVLTPRGAKGDTGHTNSSVGVTLVTTPTFAPTVDDTGGIFLLDRAGGSTITFPDAPTVGTTYTIDVKTENTAGNYVLETSGSDVLLGHVTAIDDAGAVAIFEPNAALTDTTITFNGTTTGGDFGTRISATYIDATNHIWWIEGQVVGVAPMVTPFS